MRFFHRHLFFSPTVSYFPGPLPMVGLAVFLRPTSVTNPGLFLATPPFFPLFFPCANPDFAGGTVVYQRGSWSLLLEFFFGPSGLGLFARSPSSTPCPEYDRFFFSLVCFFLALSLASWARVVTATPPGVNETHFHSLGRWCVFAAAPFFLSCPGQNR